MAERHRQQALEVNGSSAGQAIFWDGTRAI
jgi:hypothetical protein